MRVLFTGSMPFGAWTMRGEQMAAQRTSWKAALNAETRDLSGVDAVVIVKHISDNALARIKGWGGPVIYDPLDFWTRHQPRDLSRIRTLDDARRVFAFHFSRIVPDILLCPTQAMVDDLTPLGWRTELLYHHFDPCLPEAPIKPSRPTVVYQGARQNIGRWKTLLQMSCKLHGADMIFCADSIAPAAHAHVAVRTARKHWLSRRWKSNVKAATAMACGAHLVAWPENAYLETCPDAYWFEGPLGLHRAIGKALQAHAPEAERDRFSVETCANSLETLLHSISRQSVHALAE